MATPTQSTSGTTLLNVTEDRRDLCGSVISEVKITCLGSHLSKRASRKLGEDLSFKANCFLSACKDAGECTSDTAVDQAKAWLRPGSNSGPFTIENSAWQTRCFDLKCTEHGVTNWALDEGAGVTAEGDPRNQSGAPAAGTGADAHATGAAAF